MSAIKGFSSDKKTGSQQYLTLQPSGLGKVGADMLPKAVYDVQLGVSLIPEAGSTKNTIVVTGHSFKEGDVFRFTAGVHVGSEVTVVEVIDANTVGLGHKFDTAIVPADEFKHLRYLTLTLDSAGGLITSQGPIQILKGASGTFSAALITKDTVNPANTVAMPVEIESAPSLEIKVDGVDTSINQDTTNPSLSQTLPSLSHFIKNGSQVVVNYDGVTKANINAVPVMLVGADGSEATINVTTGDLNIQATHTGVNPDSMQIGDGTTILGMTITGEAKVNALQLPATLGSKIDDESLSVTQSVEDKAIQEDIKTAVESLVTVGSTEAKQDAIIADIGLLAKLTDTQPISAATLPLPTGAAEESTLQAVDSKLINIRDALPISRGSKPDAASLAVTQSTEDKLMQADIKDVLDNILLDTTALIAATQATSLDALGFYTHNFATTSVTSSAYVELVSNIGATEVKKIKIFMSNGNPLIIAQGAASAETDRFLITAGGFPDGAIEVRIPAGERLSMKALSTDLTSGLIAINLMG